MHHSYSTYVDRFKGLLRPRFVASDPLLSLSSEKDYEYVSNSFKREGIRFLTSTLPELRKAIDLSFETGHLVTPIAFRKKKGSQLPLFLFSHFERIYELDGSFRTTPHIGRLKHVRQVLEAFYKLEVPYSKALQGETVQRFVNNERYITSYLSDSGALFGSPSARELVSGAALLCRYVFDGFDPKDILPGNGPGRLATGELGDEKWLHTVRVAEIDQEYPAWKYTYHTPNMLVDLKDEYKNLKRMPFGTSKVKLVPKDSRGPRIITMEPHSYMWIQQGLRARLYDWLENRCSLTKGRVNFTDQSVNQWLAQSSSLNGEWATLDMKDASDLLSVELVKQVFRLKPRMLRCLLAARTHETLLPNGVSMGLKKFAGMGSATTFPIEAFSFWAICCSCIASQLGISLREATSFAYIYGDDIIVPTDLAEDVMAALESTGLIVNRAKSYYKGRFRESCGVDAYLSVDITPIRFKKLYPASLSDGESFEAWCSYANSFRHRGYTELSESIFKDLETIFGRIPYGIATSSFPCRIVDDVFDAEELNRATKIKRRYNDDLQRLEYRVYHLVPTDHPTTLDGYHRLTRNLLAGPGEKPSVFNLPNEVRLVKGWQAI